MSADEIQEYDDAMIAVLEAVWGEGYMSPGGPDEIRRVVEGVELVGKSVLDIGCGTGGITRFLAQTFHPRQMTGVDVEQELVDIAQRSAAEAGLADQLTFLCVEPGPLPFDDDSFDVVFSKDSMIHIADKEALFADIYRVLRPGGRVAACDWMSGSEPPFSPEMDKYIALENLGFGMASAQRYRSAMQAAGFADINIVDRNAWYRQVVDEEYKALSGALHDALASKVGQDFLDHQIDVWQALKLVVDRGELRPTHMHAVKPLRST